MKKIMSMVLFTTLLFSYEMNYDKNTTGLIRQMKVYKYPTWVAKIELASGKKIFFVSPKSMFEFYFRPAAWPEYGIKQESDFKNIYVTDFATAEPIKAKGAFYVYGSDTTSPSGDDLVPFDSYKRAEEFAKRHKGKRILGFREINRGLINWLNDSL
ncbi:nitrous oxide reductase accessory protein NosL [Sulfurimonas hydrogeniphila]|uniref:nitrous oxide reductase accessory protein NosL n=1 Tax=Sulfurimonas hydrogeniphila TaxID=2509341 RepID=UPI0012600B15|nr:nitrous oxide reductase accessory protein NosL [Sulfurimonas hydrogeniphila]